MEGNNRFVVFSEMFASNPFVNACLLMLSGQGNRDVSVLVFCSRSRRVCGRFANIPLAKDVEL